MVIWQYERLWLTNMLLSIWHAKLHRRYTTWPQFTITILIHYTPSHTKVNLLPTPTHTAWLWQIKAIFPPHSYICLLKTLKLLSSIPRLMLVSAWFRQIRQSCHLRSATVLYRDESLIWFHDQWLINNCFFLRMLCHTHEFVCYTLYP